MTATPARPRYAVIGMTITSAAQVIRDAWARHNAPENDPESLLGFSHRDLREFIRDCGWCIGHAHGCNGLRQLLDQAVKGLDRNGEGYELSREIDFAFSGICDWLL
jgi:hypothetical protein